MENNKEIPVRVTDARVQDGKVIVTCEVDVDTAKLLRMNEPKIKYSVSVKEVDGL